MRTAVLRVVAIAACAWAAPMRTVAQDYLPPWRYAARFDELSSLDPNVATVVAGGLQWLATQQSADGRWGSKPHGGHPLLDVGVTGLALLALLGNGNTPTDGPHQDTVRRGLGWLASQQDPDTGLIGTDASHDFVYGHMIASLACSEAFAMCGDDDLGAVARRALGYAERHRNPYAVWRYQPRDNDNDTSVSGWGIEFYTCARDAGLEVDPNALYLGEAWLDQMTDPDTGRTGYLDRGGRSSRTKETITDFPPDRSEACTAIALASHFHLGATPADRPVMRAHADLIAMHPPAWDTSGSIDLYYWRFGSVAMWRMGDRYWKPWCKQLEQALVGAQRRDESHAGSWDPIGAWGCYGGRVYSTAMATLALSTPRGIARAPIPDYSPFTAAFDAWQAKDLPKFDQELRRADQASLAVTKLRRLAIARRALADHLHEIDRGIDELLSGDNYVTITERLELIRREYEGLQPAERAAETLRGFRKNTKVQRSLRASRLLESICKKLDYANPKSWGGIKRQLQDLVRKFPDTHAARAAQDLIARHKE